MIHKEGLVDRRDCSIDYCKDGKIVTVKTCPPLFETVLSKGERYCYFVSYGAAPFNKSMEMCPQGSELANFGPKQLAAVMADMNKGTTSPQPVGRQMTSSAMDCIWISQPENNRNSTMCAAGQCTALMNGYPVCLPCGQKCRYMCQGCDCHKIMPSYEYPGCIYKGITYSPGTEVEIYQEVCMKLMCNAHAKLEKVYVPDCCYYRGNLTGPGHVTSVNMVTAASRVCYDVFCRGGEIHKMDKQCDCEYMGMTYDDGHVIMDNMQLPGPCSQLLCDNGQVMNVTVNCTQDCEYKGNTYTDGSFIDADVTYPAPCYNSTCTAGVVTNVTTDCQGCMYNNAMVTLNTQVYTDTSYPSPCYSLTCTTAGITRANLRCNGCWYNNRSYAHRQFIKLYRQGRRCKQMRCYNYNRRISRTKPNRCCRTGRLPGSCYT